MTRPESLARFATIRLAAITGIVFVATLATACPREPTHDPAPATTTTTAPTPPAPVGERRAGETDGAYTFRTQCAGCHGTSGEGNLGPPLTGIADRLSDADQLAIVRDGRGRMPPFSAGLTTDEIRAVTDYTRTQLR